MDLNPRPRYEKALWTTTHELAFLEQLGTGTFCDARTAEFATLLDRPALLQRYLATMALRQTWGDIDEAKVRQAVLEALGESEKLP